ncbi:YdcH family protein [Sphingopyxis chilensis]
MSKHIHYLWREHARLEAEIDREARQRVPDEVLIARLKKLKLAVKDQIAAWSSETGGSRVA